MMKMGGATKVPSMSIFQNPQIVIQAIKPIGRTIGRAPFFAASLSER